MEVGSVRERIIIALLRHKFGVENVGIDLGITEPEIDATLFGEPVSIKTITSTSKTGMSGVKAVRTVDPQSAKAFVDKYHPLADILLVQIKWGVDENKILDGASPGGIFLIPRNVQEQTISSLGKSVYFNLPKPGTNPRGVEFSGQALTRLTAHKDTRSIKILWRRSQPQFAPYKVWLDHWNEEDNG
ncbi:MAG: type II restriction endonuclease subunit R [Dehalococcoidia bacterium]|nr:type II restriction endonuclease subunit R [Dehalococcoidia bacterium]